MPLPRAKKSLGQNFLINTGVLNKIVATAQPGDRDTVIEIGPGTGNLTKRIAEHAGKVLAIEKDHRLIEPLRQQFADFSNITVLEDDVLQFQPRQHGIDDHQYILVGNIPYYLTSHLIRLVLAEWPRPKRIVLMVQQEVAQRIISHPGHENLLSLSVQLFAEAKIISSVSAGSFRPTPRVDSAIILLTPRDKVLPSGEANQVFSLLHIGFSQKRKQFLSVLSRSLSYDRDSLQHIFEHLKIPLQSRAENLTIEDWKALALILSQPQK